MFHMYSNISITFVTKQIGSYIMFFMKKSVVNSTWYKVPFDILQNLLHDKKKVALIAYPQYKYNPKKNQYFL